MIGMARLDSARVYDAWLNGGLLVATLAVLAVLYVAVIRPFESQLTTIEQEHADLALLVDRTHEITRKHQALNERIAAARKQTDEMWKRIPGHPRESDFLAQVCQLAERTGMHVADYHPGTTEVLENHHELEVKIATKGKFESLCRFLDQVDQVPRLSRLTQLEIHSPVGEPHLQVDVTYRIYFAPGTVGNEGKRI